MNTTWSRAEMVTSCKDSHQIFPIEEPIPRRTTFAPTYGNEDPPMSLLIGWEYGRNWLIERKEHLRKEYKDAKADFIAPDFNWWLNRRAALMDRRQLYLKKQENPHKKNCNLSAFANVKEKRDKVKKHTDITNIKGNIETDRNTNANVKQKLSATKKDTDKSNKHAENMETYQKSLTSKPDANDKQKCDTTNTAIDKSNAKINNAKTNQKSLTTDANLKVNSDANAIPITNLKLNLKENSDSETKWKPCNCKKRVLRCSGGQEVRIGSYGPDNRKVFYISKKLMTIPWY